MSIPINYHTFRTQVLVLGSWVVFCHICRDWPKDLRPRSSPSAVSESHRSQLTSVNPDTHVLHKIPPPV
ncbi:hypothetical protein L2E82_05324 [Cichorium intybus]|uniref:Uncharacterized protein n=1 Tax=Cichorium intybus TaxID=13427 RepID=A0ACB9H6N0_CICIN|nr:hypothetical protein L2E82_05324 [Cichorium intybus]